MGENMLLDVFFNLIDEVIYISKNQIDNLSFKAKGSKIALLRIGFAMGPKGHTQNVKTHQNNGAKWTTTLDFRHCFTGFFESISNVNNIFHCLQDVFQQMQGP